MTSSSLHTILLVEDTEAIRKLLAMILTQAGFQVIEAEHGGKAQEELRSCRPDIIVCDLVMPEVDGRELLQYLGADAELKKIPVIILSADFDSQMATELMMLGAKRVVGKLGTHAALITAIKEEIGVEG